MRFLATALALVMLAPAGTALSATGDTGAAEAPPAPQTGGAVAPEPPKPRGPVEAQPAEPVADPRPGRPVGRPVARDSVTAPPVPEPSLGRAGERATKAQSKPKTRDREGDMDVEVPVPEEAGKPEPPPPPSDPEEASAGLPRAGLDVIPLAAIGFSMTIGGLVALRLVSRRSA